MDAHKEEKNNGLITPLQTIDSVNNVISKKSDRIATALYLVTDFLPDAEPMKARLRELSLDLVRHTNNVRYGTTRHTEAHVLDMVRATIAETVSLLELSFIGGLISEMNFSVLKREYGLLRDKIEVRKATRESRTDSTLSGNFFGQGGFENTEESFTPKRVVLSETSPALTPKKVAPVEKEQSIKKTSSAPKVLDVTRESRRTRVLRLIKDKREATIKDIADHFPELSEKTIQRELIGLIEEGLLTRHGERRWSRYSLA